MGNETQAVSVAAERLSRLQRAVALASEGAFSDAMGLLDDAPRDQFGEVEQVVRSLIHEYSLAIAQGELSIDEFRASKQDLLQKIDMIEEQKAAIQKLSAPIIDVWESVIAAPLIGVLDSARAHDLAERLLARIQAARTSWVLLDLTGLERIDSPSAAHLVRLASAIRLMGAECLLTGLRGGVAQMVVSLGTSLEGLRPLSNLKEGLKYCLSRSPQRSLRG